VEILSVTIPILLFVTAGYLLKRKGFINEDTKTFLSKLVYYFAFPAMTFRSIVSFDFARTFRIKLVAQNLLVTVIIFSVMFLPTFLIRERRKRGSFHMGCFRSNQGYMGLPVIKGFYGEQAMSRAAVVNGFDSLLVILLSVFALEIYRGGNTTRLLGRKLTAFITNPFIVSSVLGLLLSYLNIPILKIGILDELLKMISGMALPLALLSIGCSIEVGHLKKNLRLILNAAAVKLVLMPLVALVTAWFLFGFRGTDLGMSIVLLATPSSVSSYVMACEMEADGELSAAIIGFTTFLSVLTISIIQLVLKTYFI
jgi:predicted permease